MLSKRQYDKLNSLLMENEELLWAGNPAVGIHMSPYFFSRLVLGGIFTAIGAFNICSSVIHTETISLKSIPFVLFLLFGLFAFLTAWTLPGIRRLTIYAVTNRRIIFMYPFKNYFLSILDLPKVSMHKKAGGIGHIFFVEEIRHGRKGGQDITTEGCVFVNIPDIQKVHILIALQRKALREESS